MFSVFLRVCFCCLCCLYPSRRFVGWKSCISVVLYVSLSCYVFVVFMSVVVCLFSPSIFKCLHLQSKKHIQQQKEKTLKENINIKKNRNLPARPLEICIFRRGSWAGNPVFLLLSVFLRVVLFCVFVSFCFVCLVSPKLV